MKIIRRGYKHYLTLRRIFIIISFLSKDIILLKEYKSNHDEPQRAILRRFKEEEVDLIINTHKTP